MRKSEAPIVGTVSKAVLDEVRKRIALILDIGKEHVGEIQ